MMILSQEFAYEVVRVLAGEGRVSHYLCKAQGQSIPGFHLIGLRQEELEPAEISILSDMKENPAFTDLKESFLAEDCIFLVFKYPHGEPFGDLIKDKLLLEQRFLLGQRVLEQFLLQSLPAYLQWDILFGGIYVDSSLTVEFYYGLNALSEYWEVGFSQVQNRLKIFFQDLFQTEAESSRYPEIEEFLSWLETENTRELIEVYQAYLLLLPPCSEERTEEKKERKSLAEQWKELYKKLLTAAKIGMGISALAVSCLLLPQMWKEKVTPVLQAAVLWKAVYVDGEIPEEVETEEPVQEPESQSQPDPDNGNVTRYWENGSIFYKGHIADGLYEGDGTLYYPDGSVEYRGGFSHGEKEGEGTLYTEEGILRYEGGFHHGKYNDYGKLYDGETGTLIYEGDFANGKYNGGGTLFNAMTDFPVYRGGFRLGYYDGEGMEYDSSGSLLYEGSFLLGIYHGSGIYYDADTGQVLMEGEFRNGIMVLASEKMIEETIEETEPAAETELTTEPETREVTTEGGEENEGTEDSVVVSETEGRGPGFQKK